MNQLEVKEKPLQARMEGVQPIKAYVWATSRHFVCSKKEWVVVEAYLEGMKRDGKGSFQDCSHALLKAGWKRNALTCQRWLEKDHVKAYLHQRLEEDGLLTGWTEGHWMKVMNDHVSGVKRLPNGDLYALKLIGDFKKFFAKDEVNVFNQAITVTQANGAI